MLEQAFLSFINEHKLFTAQQLVLVAVSGGVDSVVLAHLMHRNGFAFAIAHVNFGLRGAESDADAIFVENRATQYGVPYHQVCFDTTAEAIYRGESIQLTARRLRYDWFQALGQTHGYAAIATAHHLNDVLETMLLNLTRGTGLAGLHGIPVQTEQGVVRPLWFATRADIAAYAHAQHLSWREDASNATDHYSRNRIRQQVVPTLEQINPGLLQTLPRTIGRFRAAEAILNAELDRSLAACTTPAGNGFVIDIAQLILLPEPFYRLSQWLKPYGFSTDALAQCWQAVDQTGSGYVKTGQVIYSATHQLTHHRGHLWLSTRSPAPRQAVVLTELPTKPLDLGQAGHLTVTRVSRTEWAGNWPATAAEALFDADELSFPLTIRPWQAGDRFRPLGMEGSKLVSDLLQEHRIPLPDRAHIWVLADATAIVWVLGVRAGHPARLTGSSRQLINFRLLR